MCGGGEAAPPWGLQSLGVHHSPPLSCSPAPRVPYLVPTLPPVPRQALWERGEGWSGRVLAGGAAREGGYLLLDHDPLLAPGAHLHPVRIKELGKGCLGWGQPQHHPTLGTGSLSPRGCAMGFPVPCGGDTEEDAVGGAMVVPTRGPGSPRSPLAPGVPAPGAPCRGKMQELFPVLAAHPSHAMSPPCQGTPHRTSAVLGAQHRASSHVPPSRVVSASPRGGCSRDTP